MSDNVSVSTDVFVIMIGSALAIGGNACFLIMSALDGNYAMSAINALVIILVSHMLFNLHHAIKTKNNEIIEYNSRFTK